MDATPLTLLQNPPYPYLKLGNRFDDLIRHTLRKGARSVRPYGFWMEFLSI
ncbi:hypothetical protein MC7420_2289 [Coleofasciculus chthonoplastes PCC 7420]|uniref:Uncharacterized protein n=1 Tax=Coleofasciculus chthonoplastes PCC 7420 TaxID=118168 RepID=B4VSK8_9CYAN|nr:hypothetical protein MC7420_2289 [Coleofasciculus chthonoplastes PCC 7420]